MKIVYTKHANKKFRDLKELGIKVTKSQVNKILEDPLSLDEKSDYPKKIALGNLDKEHNLRIIYKEVYGIITVITFFPAKKGRYQ